MKEDWNCILLKNIKIRTAFVSDLQDCWSLNYLWNSAKGFITQWNDVHSIILLKYLSNIKLIKTQTET